MMMTVNTLENTTDTNERETKILTKQKEKKSLVLV